VTNFLHINIPSTLNDQKLLTSIYDINGKIVRSVSNRMAKPTVVEEVQSALSVEYKVGPSKLGSRNRETVKNEQNQVYAY
jgi:hypothetical protein